MSELVLPTSIDEQDFSTGRSYDVITYADGTRTVVLHNEDSLLNQAFPGGNVVSVKNSDGEFEENPGNDYSDIQTYSARLALKWTDHFMEHGIPPEWSQHLQDYYRSTKCNTTK